MEGTCTRIATLNSSAIELAAHNQKLNSLFITFNSGTTYRYNNVPAEQYDNLIEASSAGAYFNSAIRSQYNYELYC